MSNIQEKLKKLYPPHFDFPPRAPVGPSEHKSGQRARIVGHQGWTGGGKQTPLPGISTLKTGALQQFWKHDGATFWSLFGLM